MRSALLLFILLATLSSIAQQLSFAKRFHESTYNGSEAMRVSTDAAGNIYVTGYFTDTIDMDPGVGVYNLVAANQSINAYICKLDHNGDFVWAKALRGSTLSDAMASHADNNGNLWVIGNFSDTIDLDPGPGIVQAVSAVGYSTYILRLDTAGNYGWSYTFGEGGQGHNQPCDITTDDGGNVYATGGYGYPTTDFDPGPGVVNGGPNVGNAFILKLSPAGDFRWVQVRGTGTWASYGTRIKYKNGVVYAVAALNGSCDMLKLDTLGNVQWEKFLDFIVPLGSDVDASGNLVVGGGFKGTHDFDPGPATYNLVCSNGFNYYDAFVLKLDRDGNFLWAKSYGGAGDDFAQGVAVHPDGVLYVTSEGIGTVDFDPGSSVFNMSGSSPYVVVSEFTPGGQFIHGVQVAGNERVFSYDIQLEDAGNILLPGGFWGTTDFDPGPGTFNLSPRPPQGTDAFICRLAKTNYVTGTVFIDVNNDGIMQVTEQGLAGVVLQAVKGSDVRNAVTDNSGAYAMSIGTGNYTVSPVKLPPYYQLSTTAQAASFISVGNVLPHQNFATLPFPNIQDLQVDIVPYTPARAGREYRSRVVYKNRGTKVMSGSVTFKYDARFAFLQSLPAAATHTGNQLTWNFSSLVPTEERFAEVVVTIPAAVNGQKMYDTAMVYPVAGDTTPANNISSSIDTVIGSFDPNDKIVLPAGDLSLPFVNSDTNYLQYIVRFQNTGTDTAFNIMITDTLSSKLQVPSFTMAAASHPYSISIEDGNVVKWKFNKILLPDSNTNERLSHGFICYRIKPNNNLQLGQQVKNKATILFDYNDAVITNETINTVAATMPVNLTSFNIANNQCKQVVIQWSTAGEVNNATYTIERSNNGREWQIAGTVQGAGTTTTPRDYSFIDHHAIAGTIYYRLRQTDADGKSSYSFIRTTTCGAGAGFVKVFPNPVENTLHIVTSSAFSYVLYSVHGIEAIRGSENDASGIVNVSQLSKGVYMIKIMSSAGTSVHKLFKN